MGVVIATVYLMVLFLFIPAPFYSWQQHVNFPYPLVMFDSSLSFSQQIDLVRRVLISADQHLLHDISGFRRRRFGFTMASQIAVSNFGVVAAFDGLRRQHRFDDDHRAETVEALFGRRL